MIDGLNAGMPEYATQTTVVVMLGEIYERILAHFALEEKIMRKAGYDGFATHKQDLDRWFPSHFRTHDAILHHELG